MKLYKNLKKIYKKINFIADILYNFIISYAIFAELYNRGVFSMYSIIYLLLGLSLFIEAVRKYFKKPPIFLPLFKRVRIILFPFVISLILLTQWYNDDMSSMSVLLGGLLFFIVSVIVAVRKFKKKSS